MRRSLAAAVWESALSPRTEAAGDAQTALIARPLCMIPSQVAAVPAEYVWAAKSSSDKRSRPPPRFRRHTLSALGLRRLLATAARQKDSFSLRHTTLLPAVGDPCTVSLHTCL